jgi:hypothetical protein
MEHLPSENPSYSAPALWRATFWGHVRRLQGGPLRTKILVLSVEALLCLCVLGMFRAWVLPSVSNVRYSFDGQPMQEGSLPLRVASKGKEMRVHMTLNAAAARVSLYRIFADDCMRMIVINGKELKGDGYSFCEINNGKVVDLGSHLRTGSNDVEFVVKDTGGQGGLRLQPSGADMLMALLMLLTLSVLCAYGIAVYRVLASYGAPRVPFYLLVAGFALRLYYFFITPFNVRAYDAESHVDYIQYVAKHLAIPPSSAGWEFHQAPLYYLLTGAWLRVQQILGLENLNALRDIQFFSFLLSVAALAIAFWIGRLLFAKTPDDSRYHTFCFLMVCAPPLIFPAARASNDTLYLTLALLLIGFTIRWWKTGRAWDWYAAWIVLALAFLTKASVLPFCLILFILLLARKAWTTREKFQRCVLAGVLLVMLAAWLPALRMMEKDHRALLSFGNKGMNSALGVKNRPQNFLVFDPVQVITVPFNNPWNDASRRQYFWEYFFKSAFFGEFTHAPRLMPLAVLVLLAGMASFVVFLAGVVGEIRRKNRFNAPLLVTAGILLLTILTYRLQYPFAADQDFRFIAPIIIVLGYYAVQGAYLNEKRWGLCAKEAVLGLGLLSALFIVGLRLS